MPAPMKRFLPATKANSPDFPPPIPQSAKQRKKTRELPNLSDCHCCNRRINSTNPKNRLQTLASEWRIVLLCKSCYNLVESSKYCSYCLTNISSSSPSSLDSFYECKRCHRRVHRDCTSKFSFDSGNSGCDFSVCFDCWVPKLIENEYNVRVRGSSRPNNKKRKGVMMNDGGDFCSLGSSRVCDDSQVKVNSSLEKAANEAKEVAHKKVAFAVEAKEKAFSKAMVAKKAVELANGALGCVAVDEGRNVGGSMVVDDDDDDAKLAIRLHRAMNSSPRITRNSCLLNTHCVNVPKVGVNDSNSDGVGVHGAMETSCSNKSANIEGDATRVEINGSLLDETRQDCEQKCVRTLDEKCNGNSDLCLRTYSRKGRASQDGKCKEEAKCKEETKCKEEPDCFLKMYTRRVAQGERSNVEPNHCSKTYCRRPSATSRCKNELVYGGFNSEEGVLAPAIALNCSKESRASANAS